MTRRAGLLMVLLGLSGCSGSGAEGQAVPEAGALEHLQRPSTPNTALAAPAGFSPTPDIVTPIYPVSAQTLYAAMTQVAENTPRTTKLVAYEGRYEAAFVVRSRVLNFPDTVQFKVGREGDARSTLVLYSASRYGSSDFGVNRARVQDWLARLDTLLK